MSRANYHREYYQRTAPVRRKLKRDRLQVKRWAPRLIEAVLFELSRPERIIVLPRRLIQRPTLKLAR